jgi:hypothetical protein
MNILAFFTNSGTPATGLTPTIRVREVPVGTLVVTDQAMTELGDGHYSYDFTGYDATKDYAIRCDGGITLPSGERYTYAGNENYYEDTQQSVWSTPVTAYTGKNMTGAMQTLIYSNEIHVDTVSGAGTGTNFPWGTLRFPINDFDDAVQIARTRGIFNIHIHDSLSIPAGTDATDLIFDTPGYMDTFVTIEAGASVNRSAFRYLNLQGEVSNGDVILAENCTLYNIENFTGVVNTAVLGQASEISLGSGGWAEMIFLTAGGDAGNEPEINIGNATLHISHLSGNLKLTGKTGIDKTIINSDSSTIIIDSTCVSGSIELIGMGAFEDNSGPNCSVDTDAFISLISISDHVWDEEYSGHTGIGSFGGILQRMAGLVHENIYIDQPVYDGDGNMTSARLRLYSNPASVGTVNDVIGTYQITAPGDGAGRFTYWKQVRS